MWSYESLLAETVRPHMEAVLVSTSNMKEAVPIHPKVPSKDKFWLLAGCSSVGTQPWDPSPGPQKPGIVVHCLSS